MSPLIKENIKLKMSSGSHVKHSYHACTYTSTYTHKERAEETFVYVDCIDYGDGYTDVCVSPNS